MNYKCYGDFRIDPLRKPREPEGKKKMIIINKHGLASNGAGGQRQAKADQKSHPLFIWAGHWRWWGEVD